MMSPRFQNFTLNREVRMRNIIYLFVMVMAVSGCMSIGTAQRISSGKIGCPPNEIIITNFQQPIISPITWVAECKGKKYFCTESVIGSCAEAK